MPLRPVHICFQTIANTNELVVALHDNFSEWNRLWDDSASIIVDTLDTYPICVGTRTPYLQFIPRMDNSDFSSILTKNNDIEQSNIPASFGKPT